MGVQCYRYCIDCISWCPLLQLVTYVRGPGVGRCYVTVSFGMLPTLWLLDSQSSNSLITANLQCCQNSVVSRKMIRTHVLLILSTTIVMKHTHTCTHSTRAHTRTSHVSTRTSCTHTHTSCTHAHTHTHTHITYTHSHITHTHLL